MLANASTTSLPLFTASSGELTRGSAMTSNGSFRPSWLVPNVLGFTWGRFASSSQNAITSAYRDVALNSLFSADQPLE